MKKIIIYIDDKIFFGFFMNLYRSISINRTISKLNQESENISLYYYNKSKKNTISELCFKHGSDKGYLDFFLKLRISGNLGIMQSFILNFLITAKIKLD